MLCRENSSEMLRHLCMSHQGFHRFAGRKNKLRSGQESKLNNLFTEPLPGCCSQTAKSCMKWKFKVASVLTAQLHATKTQPSSVRSTILSRLLLSPWDTGKPLEALQLERLPP